MGVTESSTPPRRRRRGLVGLRRRPAHRARRRGQRQRLDEPRLPPAPRRRLDADHQGLLVRLVLPVRRGPRPPEPLRPPAARHPLRRDARRGVAARRADLHLVRARTCGRSSTTTCRAARRCRGSSAPSRSPTSGGRWPSSTSPAPTSPRRSRPARRRSRATPSTCSTCSRARSRPRNFELPPESIGVLWRHTHRFLERLVELGYDEWRKIPVLVDWNLGNFSVAPRPDGSFRLFSRWDYDWFRIEPRLLDFYFLSRVSSRTGDRTRFTYGAHTLVEPTFLALPRGLPRRVPDERGGGALPARGVPLLHPQLRRARGRPVLPPRLLPDVPRATRCAPTCPPSTSLDISPLAAT